MSPDPNEHKHPSGPWRKVALILTRRNAGRNGGSWYVLTLECGHEVTRPVRSPHPVELLHGMHRLPKAPKKCRCMWCAKGWKPVPVVYEPGINAD